MTAGGRQGSGWSERGLFSVCLFGDKHRDREVGIRAAVGTRLCRSLALPKLTGLPVTMERVCGLSGV